MLPGLGDSIVTQGDDRFDSGCAAGQEITREESDDGEDHRHGRQSAGGNGAYAVEEGVMIGIIIVVYALSR